MSEDDQAKVDRSALEALRKRLLDLSGRSTLLNYKHQHKNHVRLVDELPAQLASRLLDGSEVRLDPIPAPRLPELVDRGYVEVDAETGDTRELRPPPSASEWGRELSFDMSVDLPADTTVARGDARHSDDVAQTQYFAQELENRLSNLGRRARLSIQERGANVLYLAFGFMEWMPEGETAKSYHSPLFLIPVSLRQESARKRGSGRHPPWFVKWTEEELLPNLSLHERLKRDFGQELPPLDDDTSVEGYLSAVEQLAVDLDATWRVRRFGTLGLFSFAKLLMYLDLDPARWPGESVLEHQLLGKLIGSGVEDESAGQRLDEIYELEEQKQSHIEYPVVVPADPSQHSVIKDVVDSRSLVVQGPPGTGKSQTITNLIAAALATGKSVLFVAEKMAALDVVYRNLERAGLAEFALNLHNHTGNKRHAVDGLRERLEFQVRFRARDFDREQERWEERRAVLTAHARRINQEWQATDRTIHQLLTEAVACSDLLEPATAVHARSLRFETHAKSDWLDGLTRSASALAETWRELGEPAVRDPAWLGLGGRERDQATREKIMNALKDWQESLCRLVELVPTIDALPPALAANASISALTRYCHDVEYVVENADDIVDDRVSSIGRASLDELDGLLAESQRCLHARAELQGLVEESVWARPPEPVSFQSARAQLAAIDPQQLKEVSDLRREERALAELIAEVQRALDLTQPAVAACGPEWRRVCGASCSGLRWIVALAKSLSELPDDATAIRGPEFEPSRVRPWLDELRQALAQLRHVEARICVVLEPDDAYNLRTLIDDLLVCRATPFWNRLTRDYRTSRDRLRSVAQKGVRVSAILKVSDEVETYVALRSALAEHPGFAHLGGALNGARTDEGCLERLAEWYLGLDDAYGSGFGQSAALAAALKTGDAEQLLGAKKVLVPLLDPLIGLISRIEALQKLYPAHVWGDDTQLVGECSLLDDLRGRLDSLATAADGVLRSQQLPFERFDGVLASLVAYCESSSRLDASGIDDAVLGGYLRVLDGGVDEAKARLRAVQRTLDVVRAILAAQTPGLRETLLASWSRDTSDALTDVRSTLAEHLTATEERRERFELAGRVEPSAWFAGGGLSDLVSRNARALDAEQELGKWIECNSISHPLLAVGLASLVDRLRASPQEWASLSTAVRLAVLQQWTDAVVQAEPELVAFSVAPHEELRREFRACDEQLRLLQRQRIAKGLLGRRVPPGVNGTRVSELTERALVRHEVDKKQRHLPPRQLLKRAGEAIQALAPCFMMSPMSVAQYLDPTGLGFDLLVMDEASQIRPEDALGAIARARQLVVVGDSNQLPPTRFFDTLDADTNSDEDEVTIAEDSESILDTCRTAFPSRSLMWHYRSRDPSLIAFSNAYFYENRLTLFPSPFKSSADHGVRHHFVNSGVFRGRRNSNEADAVAELVEWHLLNRPDESIGVVAMNSEQRDAIDAALYARAQDNPSFLVLLEEQASRAEELFVKNLETVQGDERDVIAISMTYGPERQGGKVPNRFGPIGQAVGWRRLNVLFSRSRVRMHVFTSMRSSDVRPSSEESRGPVALRDFLKYVETGYLHGSPVESGRPPDSEFEVSVANRLALHGLHVRAQIGVKNYFIDLAIVHPDDEGRYILGVECDGATYHSAKSARERDWLRQSILEDLGWEIFRIWSTDWFEDPDAVIERLLRRVADLRTDTRVRADLPAFSSPTLLEAKREPDDDGEDAVVEAAATSPAASERERSLIPEPADPMAPEDDGPTASKASGEFSSLAEELQAMEAARVRPQFPRTPPGRRLLRHAMIEAIDQYRPLDRRQFGELPEYLRVSTSPEEAHEFLDAVLRVVERWEIG